MNRGDVYWVDLGSDLTKGAEIKKKRPCVIISVLPINQVRRTIVVIPLSTKPKTHPPIVVAVKCDGKSVVAICDQIRAVDKTRFKNKIGSLSCDDLDIIDDSLRQILSL